MKQSVTIFCTNEFYRPGYKGGGPVNSLANLFAALGAEFRFRLFTRSRDLGERTPYADVLADRWVERDGAELFYCGGPVPPRLFAELRRARYDILYCNSFFNPLFTVLPIVFHKLLGRPADRVLVAPRGEFTPGKLEKRRLTKELFFLLIVRLLGVYRGVRFHATTETEVADIRRRMGDRPRIDVACNLPAAPPELPAGLHPPKAAGTLNAVFLSRISPEKNILGAIELIAGCPNAVHYDIYGSMENPAYWQQCEAAIAKLPPRHRVRYRGTLPHEKVPETLARYDLFFFPTKGENYGHVIVEAMQSGVPVLISDRTPWQQLERVRAGAVLPLEAPEAWPRRLAAFAAMDDNAWRGWSDGARRAAAQQLDLAAIRDASRRLFSRQEPTATR